MSNKVGNKVKINWKRQHMFGTFMIIIGLLICLVSGRRMTKKR